MDKLFMKEYLKDRTFIGDSTTLLNEILECSGDTARLAMRLSRAVNRLEKIVSVAQKQFREGETKATFTQQEIADLNLP